MTWYLILFIIVTIIFTISSLITIFGGDLDVDSPDFDTSDIFSFKGFIHFSLGFSLTLVLFENHNIFTYIIAIIIGLLFVGALVYIYKLMYKLKQEQEYDTYFENIKGSIYYWDNETQKGEVTVVMNGKQLQVPLISNDCDTQLQTGDLVIASGTRNLLIINN